MKRPEKKEILKGWDDSSLNAIGFNACHDAHTEWFKSEEFKKMLMETLNKENKTWKICKSNWDECFAKAIAERLGK